MLHLQAGIHFHEEVVVLRRAVDEKLHGARASVVDGAGQLNSGACHAIPQLFRQSRGRCFLDNLLVPALNRAVAVEQVHDVAVLVGENLKLHVPRSQQIFLEQQFVVAK